VFEPLQKLRYSERIAHLIQQRLTQNLENGARLSKALRGGDKVRALSLKSKGIVRSFMRAEERGSTFPERSIAGVSRDPSYVRRERCAVWGACRGLSER